MNRGILTIGATKKKTRVPREQRKRETSKKRGQGKHLEEVTSYAKVWGESSRPCDIGEERKLQPGLREQ